MFKVGGVSIIICIIIIVSLFSVIFVILNIFTKTGVEISPEKISEEAPPRPPKESVSVYKGFWMPCLFMNDICQPMAAVQDLKDVGANIVAFGPTVKINAEGEINFGLSDELLEKRLAELAKRYYDAGIRIYLVVETLYVKDFSDNIPAGGPTAFPADVVSATDFFEKYNSFVEKMAQLAEKYRVEFFSPMNEPDLKLGEKVASDWGQEILPRVKKYYSGKVLYKAALANGAGPNINFAGYDAIGIDISPGGGPEGPSLTRYSSDVEKTIDNVLNWASRDGVSDVLFAEFGVWGGALSLSEEEKAEVHKIIFEKGKGRVKGFIALDPPMDLDRPLKGTKTLEEIKRGFGEI